MGSKRNAKAGETDGVSITDAAEGPSEDAVVDGAADTTDTTAADTADTAGAAATEVSAPLQKPEDGKQWYVNKGSHNLFTEGGACRPDQTVQLTEDEAKQYKGLEPCQ